MSKEIKQMMIQELAKSFKDVTECVVIDISALDSEETFQFREDMRAASIEVKGVKNSLTRKALEGHTMEGVGKVLTGSCAISYSDTDSVTLAKALVKWAKGNDKLAIKGGYTEGNVLDTAGVDTLSKMPSREELLATIAGQIMGPASQIAGQISGPGSSIAGQVKTHYENQE